MHELLPSSGFLATALACTIVVCLVLLDNGWQLNTSSIAPHATKHHPPSHGARTSRYEANGSTRIKAAFPRECTFVSKDFGNVNYDCSSNLDPDYFRQAYPDSSELTDAEIATHYNEGAGILLGRRAHRGPRTMKIILMTRDDWPLIRSWVLYHADVFSGENIYILDGSSDERQLQFMRLAVQRLKVNYFRSSANLNTLEVLIQELFANLALSCDFITKVDADEFIVSLVREDSEVPLLSIETGHVSETLDTLPLDGGRYKFTYFASSVPETGCTIDSDPAHSTRYKRPTKLTAKTFFSARTVASIDLGNHQGVVKEPPFDRSSEHETDLAIAHHHWRCFASYYKNTEKAMISHGYINQNDTVSAKISSLESVISLGLHSNHKAKELLGILQQGPTAAEASYNARFSDLGSELFSFSGLRDSILRLTETWEYTQKT